MTKTKELWRDVKGWFGLYRVSTLGRVYSVRNALVLAASSTGTGYPMVCLARPGIRRQVMVHRLVAKAFVPNPGRKLMVNHRDGNKLNACADNLEWIDHIGNVVHAAKVLKAYARFSDEAIAKVHAMFNAGARQIDIAEATGISRGYISLLVNGRGRKYHGLPAVPKVPPPVVDLSPVPEEWRPVPGYLYGLEASNLGRVRKTAMPAERKCSERGLLRQTKHKTGYLTCPVQQEHGKTTPGYIHRLVALAFLGAPPNDGRRWVVDHINGDRACNDVRNLRWLRHSDNIRRAFGHGTHD